MRRSHPRRRTDRPDPVATPPAARAAAAPALRRAAAEALEGRTLLTTIIGGDTFEFSANEDTWVRIVAVGNITAEFIGASTDAGGNTTLRDLPGQFFAATDPNRIGQVSGGGLITEWDDGILTTDIYRIVITSSDADAQLIIGAVDPFDPDDTEPRRMQPFAGGAGAFRVVNNRTGERDDITAPGGTGEVLVGSRIAEGEENEEIANIPILAATTTTAFGPIAAGTTIQPGLTVLPGNDLGSFLLGGTLTGTVDAGGSIERFYAGWLVTGDLSNGDPLSRLPASPFGAQALPNNFSVAGDLRTLIVNSSVGTSQGGGVTYLNYTYASGFDAEIGGELEYFRTPDAFLGNLHVSNAPGVGFASPGTALEVEARPRPGQQVGDAFQAGVLTNNTFFNDTRETAQFLGSIGSDDNRGFAQVTGTLEGVIPGDTVDFYSLALMAGRNHTVRVTGGAGVVVYDPDGRRVASNRSYRSGPRGVFSFKADRPGIYSFRVQSPVGPIPYELTVSNAGNLAVGGLVVGTNLVNEGLLGGVTQDPNTGDIVGDEALDTTGFVARNGDWGALYVGGTASFGRFVTLVNPNALDFSAPDDIRVARGNLRALDGGQFGVLQNNVFSAMPSIEVTRGDVGHVRTRAGLLALNSLVAAGNVQLIHAIGTAYLQLAAGKGLGILRAGDMATVGQSSIFLNVDDRGSDGILGLIDVTGDFGTLATGGPAISTGQGGNVKFIRVQGNVYQDPQFAGGGSFDPLDRGSGQAFAAGEPREFRDDGGGRVTLTPLGPTRENAAYNPADPTSPLRFGPQLHVVTYGIRGSGGVVIVDAHVVDDDPDPTTINQGLRITGRGNARGRAAAEVGTITVSGANVGTLMTPDALNQLPVYPGGNSNDGRTRGPLRFDANGNPVPNDSLGIPVNRYDILIDGSGPVDLYEVFQPPPPPAFPRPTDNIGITSIVNSTPGGDITMIRGLAPRLDVGRVYARGNIGVPETVVGVDLNSSTNMSRFGVYPFTAGQYTGINVSNVGEIIADRAIGHVSTYGNGITRVIANADGRDTRDVFEGIAGAIHTGFIQRVRANGGGDLGFVDVGEGIAASGTGEGSRAGLYAEGTLFGVTANNADIRGDVMSATQVRDIVVRNGSIIGANIWTIDDPNPPNPDPNRFLDASVAQPEVIPAGEQPGIIFAPAIGTIQGQRDANVRNINVTGNGGIIGAFVLTPVIGNIDVDNGFGIFTTDISTSAAGTTERITTDGYGMRYVTYKGGSRLGQLRANGSGRTISTNEYSRNVRQSERVRADDIGELIDPNSGLALSQYNDIHAVLGTSNRRTRIRDVTIDGVMEAVNATGSRSLGYARAHIMRAGNEALVPETATVYPMQLAFADRIDSINTTGRIDGLQVTTGELRKFTPGSDVNRLSVNVAGALKDLRVRGSLGQDSVIRASGANGTIGTVQIDDNLDGTIRANRSIDSVRVNGRVNGKVMVDEAGSDRTAIRSIRVGRATNGGTFEVDGNIGTLRLDREFGQGGDQALTINGDVGTLIAGAAIKLALTVNGDLGRLQVANGLEGDLTVRDNLGDLVVTSRTTDNERDTVKGNVTVGGTIDSVRVTRGNVNGNITAGGTINAVRVDAGSLRAGKAITSQQGDIGTVRVSRDLFGRVVADGRFGTVQIGRDLGNGADLAGVTATDGGDLIVGRNVKAGVVVEVFSRLELLRVGGNVEAGADIRAGTIVTRDIKGSTEGSVTG